MKGYPFIMLLFFGFLSSCYKDIPDIYKTSEHIYYNLSSDTITQIKLEIQVAERPRSLDSILINKQILPGDSLLFSYNLENSVTSSITDGVFYTVVSFKNLPIIYNNEVSRFRQGGFFTRKNRAVGLTYISNSKLLYCAKFRDYVDGSKAPQVLCDLSLLKEDE